MNQKYFFLKFLIQAILLNKKITNGFEALDEIRLCGEWIPFEATALIRKELIELEELKQMEQELGCDFKYIYYALKAGCVIEFNGKVVAHAKKS